LAGIFDFDVDVDGGCGCGLFRDSSPLLVIKEFFIY